MRAAPTRIGQLGRDPPHPVIEIELRVKADNHIAKVVIRLWRTGFSHRNLGAQRFDRPP